MGPYNFLPRELTPAFSPLPFQPCSTLLSLFSWKSWGSPVQGWGGKVFSREYSPISLTWSIWPSKIALKKKKNIYIYIYMCVCVCVCVFYLTVPGVSCSSWDLWSLWHVGWLVATCRNFSCGMHTLSCGTWGLVPWPRMEHGPPAWGKLLRSLFELNFPSSPIFYYVPAKFNLWFTPLTPYNFYFVHKVPPPGMPFILSAYVHILLAF